MASPTEKKTRKQFSMKDRKFFIDNKDNMTYREMASSTGHTKGSVGHFFRRHYGAKKELAI